MWIVGGEVLDYETVNTVSARPLLHCSIQQICFHAMQLNSR